MNCPQIYQLQSTATQRTRLQNYQRVRMECRPSGCNSPHYIKSKIGSNELEYQKTPRFKKEETEGRDLHQGSHPKLEYLRNCQGIRTSTFQNRFVKKTSFESLPPMQPLSLISQYFKDVQVAQKAAKSIKRKSNLVEEQYYQMSQQKQAEPKRLTASQKILPKSMFSQPLNKISHDVTFRIQSTEIQQDKKSISTFQSDDNMFEKRTQSKTYLDHSDDDYSSKRKLTETQIKKQEQLYRSLIRSSSREGNVTSKQQLKNKMKVVLDEIYSLKKLLKV